MHVLVIEEKEEIAPGMFDFLEAKGCIVDVAGCGMIGNSLALPAQYAALVLDVMLPGMDGNTLCRNLQKAGCRKKLILIGSARDMPKEHLVKHLPLSETESHLRIVFL
jgi:DNA-binding response OmpR family regulator